MKIKKWIAILLILLSSVLCFGASTDYKVTNDGEIYSYDLITKGPWIDVRAYGAVGDGVTDDRANIQTVLDLGGNIFFPDGTYLVSNAGTVTYRTTAHYYSLKIKSNTTLRFGANTTIKLANAGNSHVFTNDGIAGAGNSNIFILGPVTIDCNQANQTDPATGEQSGGLFYNVTNLHLDNVKFTNVREYALRVSGITKGRFTNLWCTDSDGSGFAFGLDAVGYHMTECFFDNIKSENCLGGFVGATGNGFIFQGNHCQIGSLYANTNAFGDKIQDTSSYIEVDKVIARGITGDHGFKIVGTDVSNRANHITVNSIQTYGSYYSGIFIEKVSDISIGKIISEGDDTNDSYPAVWIGEGLRQSYDSIIINNSKNVGLTIRGDAQYVNIGKVIITDSGQTTPSANVSIIGDYVNIDSIQTTTSGVTVTKGIDFNANCSSIIIGKIIAKGTFTSGAIYPAANTLVLSIGESIVEDVSIATLADSATPSLYNGDKKWLTGGTTTITNILGGWVGKEIQIISEHAITITDGTNIFLNGSANFVMDATDTLTLIQKADGKWYEIGRSDN